MIRLEPIAPEHAPALQPLLEGAGVAESTPFPHPYPPDGARAYVAGLVEGRAAGTREDFAILTPEGLPIGVALIKDIDRARGEGELGYWLGVPHWGQGHATTAATALVGHAFSELGLTLLKAYCLASNHASLRVLAKLGFTETARQPWAQAKWPEPRECIVLELRRGPEAGPGLRPGR